LIPDVPNPPKHHEDLHPTLLRLPLQKLKKPILVGVIDQRKVWQLPNFLHVPPEHDLHGTSAEGVEIVLAFNTTNNTCVSDFQVSFIFVIPSCKTISGNPPSKNAYLRGAGHPHNAFQMARWPSGALLVAPIDGR
jgi:hypothetical protein